MRFHSFTSILPFVLLGVLAGCADNGVSDVRDQMVGMTGEDLSNCLGEPVKKANDGTTEVWTYYEPDGPDASPMDMPLQATSSSQPVSDMGKRSCLVTVKLEADKVMTVDYANLAISRQDQECAPAIQRCAR
jgi:hypothetical protein